MAKVLNKSDFYLTIGAVTFAPKEVKTFSSSQATELVKETALLSIVPSFEGAKASTGAIDKVVKRANTSLK